MIKQNKILLQNLANQIANQHLIWQKPTVLLNDKESINIHYITENFRQEVQKSNLNCILILDLIPELIKNNTNNLSKESKVYYQIPIKTLFKSFQYHENNLNNYLQGLNIQTIVKDQTIQSIYSLQKDQQKQFIPFSIRIFPFKRSLTYFSQRLFHLISPLNKNDILSYQKFQRLCKFQYVLAIGGYSQSSEGNIYTEIFLNWGKTEVSFQLTYFDNSQTVTIQLKCMDILIVPAGFSYKLIVATDSIAKLLTWNIMPKKSLPIIIQHLQSTSLGAMCPYAINQVIVDYSFHEFSLIHAKNQDFIYTLANFINNLFLKDNELLKKLGLQEQQINIGQSNDKTDECEICGKFIFNFYAMIQHKVICLYCASQNIHDRIYKKMQASLFTEGCSILSRIQIYKDQLIKNEQPITKILQNAVFYNYQDYCSGNFVGSYHNFHCKTYQVNYNKNKNTKQQIVQKTINHLKTKIKICTLCQIAAKYSTIKCENQTEKNLYKQILVKVSHFLTKQDKINVLSQLIPQFQQNNLKLFGIKLLTQQNA